MNIGQKRAVWIFSFKHVTMVFVSNNIHRPKLSIKISMWELFISSCSLFWHYHEGDVCVDIVHMP